MSDHDVVRHATRYGLPQDGQRNGPLGFVSFCREFLSSGGTRPNLDIELGVRRARAVTLMMLALPGCAYLYQWVHTLSYAHVVLTCQGRGAWPA